MSEKDEPQRDVSEADEGVPAGPAATPIDHPYFLPGLTGLMTLWFGYDILFDAEMMKEHPTFNYGGFVVALLATLWFGYKGYKEVQELRAEARDQPDDASPPSA